MADKAIEFKGTSFTVSVLHLNINDLDKIKQELTVKIAQAPDFFNLVPIAVNIEKLSDTIDYSNIKKLVESFNFIFVGFTGSISSQQRASIRTLGFSFINAVKQGSTKHEALKYQDDATTLEVPNRNTVKLFTDKVHHGQIRSGQQLYAKDQNLVIVGSVSAGAEVIADGNIHIYGALRGRAIAGAKGHQKAQIYCQKLEAELVSINGNYWLSESMNELWGTPVYIHLNDTELMSSKLV